MKKERIIGFELNIEFERDIEVRELRIVGVESLREIEEGKVVYIYNEGEKVIRKIEVGKEVVEGRIKESKEKRLVVEG